MTTFLEAADPVTTMGDWLTTRALGAGEREHVDRIQDYQRLKNGPVRVFV